MKSVGWFVINFVPVCQLKLIPNFGGKTWIRTFSFREKCRFLKHPQENIKKQEKTPKDDYDCENFQNNIVGTSQVVTMLKNISGSMEK